MFFICFTTHLCFWELHHTQAQEGHHPASHTVVVQGIHKLAVLGQDKDLQVPLVQEGS